MLACDQDSFLTVNCTAPRYLPRLIAAARAVTDKPLVVYPNSGETYDPGQRTWIGVSDAEAFATEARRWYAGGARLMVGEFLLRIAVALPLVCAAAALTLWAVKRGWLRLPRAAFQAQPDAPPLDVRATRALGPAWISGINAASASRINTYSSGRNCDDRPSAITTA